MVEVSFWGQKAAERNNSAAFPCCKSQFYATPEVPAQEPPLSQCWHNKEGTLWSYSCYVPNNVSLQQKKTQIPRPETTILPKHTYVSAQMIIRIETQNFWISIPATSGEIFLELWVVLGLCNSKESTQKVYINNLVVHYIFPLPWTGWICVTIGIRQEFLPNEEPLLSFACIPFNCTYFISSEISTSMGMYLLIGIT